MRWETSLGDAPRRLGRADSDKHDEPTIETFYLRGLADVSACFDRMKTFAEYENQYQFDEATRFVMPGYCVACGWGNLIVKDYGTRPPPWRETALCCCGMNTRMRTVLDWLVSKEGASSEARIYCTEATTPFFRSLSGLYRNAVGSEYIADRIAPGGIDDRGVLCQNLESLTFPDDTFDYIVTLDVLEHVFSYQSALSELVRVLKPGGVALITVPFRWDEERTVQRARLNGQTVEHLLPPAYHSDPIRKGGALVTYDYGWDLVRTMQNLGWREIVFMHVWCEAKKYFGRNFILRAVKPLTRGPVPVVKMQKDLTT
jgi:hypothetical protein